VAITCPHGCGVSYDAQQAQVFSQVVAAHKSNQWLLVVYLCPDCHEVMITLRQREVSSVNPKTVSQGRIYPLGSRSADSSVPAPYKTDFEEAATILAMSPQASAALARRTLQAVLVDVLGASGKTLEKQIDSVAGQLPSHVADGLHALRHIGNFGAHPIKDTSTGEVVPVEPGEAEWTLDILEALFDHAFVAPARTATRRAQLNEKLAATGKPLLEDT